MAESASSIDEGDRCAVRAAAQGEPQYATASQVRRWLLVEQPGPWGRDALLESRFPVAAGRELAARARPLGIRVLLLRRHGRDDTEPPHRVFAVVGGDGGRVEELDLERPAEVLGVDLDALARGRSVGGRPVEHPLYLVCTNGRHDVCCAIEGRPLAAALSAARPKETWECSHVGGDRFAGNLVVLPSGLYLGRVSAEDAVGVVQSLEDGRLPLPFLRGRAGWPFAVQAAEHLVREREGLIGLADLRLVRWEHRAARDVEVVFSTREGTLRIAEVEVVEGDPSVLTCSASRWLRPPRYRLRSLRRSA